MTERWAVMSTFLRIKDDFFSDSSILDTTWQHKCVII